MSELLNEGLSLSRDEIEEIKRKLRVPNTHVETNSQLARDDYKRDLPKFTGILDSALDEMVHSEYSRLSRTISKFAEKWSVQNYKKYWQKNTPKTLFNKVWHDFAKACARVIDFSVKDIHGSHFIYLKFREMFWLALERFKQITNPTDNYQFEHADADPRVVKWMTPTYYKKHRADELVENVVKYPTLMKVIEEHYRQRDK